MRIEARTERNWLPLELPGRKAAWACTSARRRFQGQGKHRAAGKKRKKR
jgi:hypothetical protein